MKHCLRGSEISVTDILLKSEERGYFMSKVLVINGGPRKNGNTFQIVQWAIEGVIQKGAEVEVVHLIDLNIKHCTGCNTCAIIGHCAIKDDHESVCKKLEKAEGLIICSPIYAGTCSSIIKTFEHRLANTLGFTGRFSHLCSVGITTGDFDFRSKNAKSLAGTIISSWEKPGYITGYIHKSKINNKNNLRITITKQNSPKLYLGAVKMGRKLVNDIEKDRKGKLPFIIRIVFNKIVLPGIARIMINQKEDAVYLYNLLEKRGYIDENIINKVKKKNARLKSINQYSTIEKLVFNK